MRPNDIDAVFEQLPPDNRVVAQRLCDGLVARGVRPSTSVSLTTRTPRGVVNFYPVPISIWVNRRRGTVWLHNFRNRAKQQQWTYTGLNEIAGYEEVSARLAILTAVRQINACLEKQSGLHSRNIASGTSPEPPLECLRAVVDLDTLLTIYDPVIAAALGS
jgi:hypothetical protein